MLPILSPRISPSPCGYGDLEGKMKLKAAQYRVAAEIMDRLFLESHLCCDLGVLGKVATWLGRLQTRLGSRDLVCSNSSQRMGGWQDKITVIAFGCVAFQANKAGRPPSLGKEMLR